MCGQSFEERFIQLYKQKGLTSCYEISYLSGNKLTQDYLSHLINDPIWKPRRNTLEKLARVFAGKTYPKKYGPGPVDEEKMKKLWENELRELEDFFKKARQEIQPNATSSPGKPKPTTWKIILQTESNDAEIYRILGELEKLGNGIISVKEIKRGSIVLILESSSEAFERIQSLYRSHQLSDLLNVPVLDLQVLSSEERVNLNQWFENIFVAGWQRVEELLTPQQLRPAVWSDRVKQAKLFNLRADLISHSVILVINLTRESENKVSVWLQVYPSSEDYLPLNLKLLVLADGEIFEEVTARSADVLIQCQFDADPGDEFSVKLALEEVSVTENFVV